MPVGIIGFVITVIFLPDTTGLDLGEIDRMNKYMVADRVSLATRCFLEPSSGCERAVDAVCVQPEHCLRQISMDRRGD